MYEYNCLFYEQGEAVGGEKQITIGMAAMHVKWKPGQPMTKNPRRVGTT